ncbi:DUF4232 domain-containing protein [Streptomyces sp. NBC_00378]|uniref:DUF4232 domain-containing protein n=1 Tax=unclassified Streptomyces TaxID=2593676 RepID=UPI00225816E7|nr:MULTISPECIES: DUF4232 domain-containing protein [unclassified Streptomyces]MCX5111354.1 DUF4232 domain-containing protein [Streptomyces sp. NBC_00378]
MNLRTHARKGRKDRLHPRGWRSYALGGAVVAVLLASTACEPGGDDGSDGSKGRGPTSPTSPTGSVKPGETGAPKPEGTSGESGGKGDSGGKATTAACTTEDLAVSAVKEPADSKEARHLLLTVQNAGDRKCDLYRYPLVRLGADARTTVPVIKDSDPDAGRPVTIAPGEEAYAALLVSGGARDEYEAKSITLGLQGGKSGSGAGKPVDVPMPVDTLYADDGQLVTYWTTASGYALDFIMSK